MSRSHRLPAGITAQLRAQEDALGEYIDALERAATAEDLDALLARYATRNDEACAAIGAALEAVGLGALTERVRSGRIAHNDPRLPRHVREVARLRRAMVWAAVHRKLDAQSRLMRAPECGPSGADDRDSGDASRS
jgi:hypothetical protein